MDFLGKMKLQNCPALSTPFDWLFDPPKQNPLRPLPRAGPSLVSADKHSPGSTFHLCTSLCCTDI